MHIPGRISTVAVTVLATTASIVPAISQKIPETPRRARPAISTAEPLAPVYAEMLGVKSLAEISYPALSSILGALHRSHGVLPADGSYLDFSQPEQEVIAVPLQPGRTPESFLYLYFFPKTGDHFYFQVSRSPRKDNRIEVRLWGEGDPEILISEDGAELLEEPSEFTFRLGLGVFDPKLPVRGRALAPDELISCIANTLGIDLDFSSFTNALALITCSAIDIYGTVQTVLHCFSMFSVGAANITSTAGCLTGIAHIVSCGYINCRQSPSPPLPSPPPPGSDPCLEPIPLNANFQGSWTSSCVSEGRSGRYARYYTFSLSAQTEVQIDLQSSVDTYLILRTGTARTGSIVELDDDDGDGLNSMIRRSLAPGSYTIEATTYSSGATGSFGISVATVATSPPPPPGSDSCLSQMSIDSTVTSSWTSSCLSERRSGRYARYYSFSLSTQASIKIDLESSTDPYLILTSGTGSIVAIDDDGGTGLNSQIIRTLGSGNYTIEATTYSSGALGSFRLSLFRR